jgi:hypothetical protein
MIPYIYASMANSKIINEWSSKKKHIKIAHTVTHNNIHIIIVLLIILAIAWIVYLNQRLCLTINHIKAYPHPETFLPHRFVFDLYISPLSVVNLSSHHHHYYYSPIINHNHPFPPTKVNHLRSVSVVCI